MVAPVPMTPKEIVHELNKYIVGQNDAKRAVAIALRNCWRRLQVAEELRDEITSKNILMIGPTGVGKTEMARRLAKIANAPFIKVEATKFTEVGYVGRDVESIIRDLVDIAFKQLREQEISKKIPIAEENAETRILDALLPKPRTKMANEPADDEASNSKTRQKFRTKFRKGELDDKEIEIDVSASSIGVEIMGPPGMEEMTSQLQNIFQNLNADKTKTRKLKIKEAFRLLKEEEAAKLINEEDLRSLAVHAVEQKGIVFIDEFDKITRRESASGADVSREGVQRDLLPLVEGSTVTTKYGMIKTDHILFIASGAFHVSKPSDLIPEMQGRFPIRVELKPLSAADFKRILTEPNVSLIVQHKALLATEGVDLEFKEDAIQRLAEIAWQVNERNENIGARRLHTILERLLEKISFDAPDHGGEQFIIDIAYVNESLEALAKDQDLSDYIL